MRRGLRAATSPAYLVLYLLLVVGFVLRVHNNSYGLPYVYNVDEGSHFTARAVGMLGGDWNPHYFQNPSAFTYLAHFALAARFGHRAIDEFKLDPTGIYVTSRTVAAVLCMLGVVAVFWAGRRLWGAGAAVASAALLTFAFLPVTYSRIAVTDVGTLAPVALSIVASVLVWEDGRLRWWILAGAGAGLAVGFKYTAGVVLLPLGIAAIAHLVRGGRDALGRCALGGLAAALAALLAFFATNPYFFFEFSDAHRQLSAQAATAGDFGKVGQTTTGLPYYLGSLTWGIGWVGALAALAGAVLELRRDVVRGLILISFPLGLLAYLALQARFFSRWLLPAYPVLVLLAGSALWQAAEALAGVWTRMRARRAGAGSGARGSVVAAGAPTIPGVVAGGGGFVAPLRAPRGRGHAGTRPTARPRLGGTYPP